ncbi:MAG TPA: hypothetical protein VNJ47_03110 [Nevskiales bacterium]|nr:hypothetical protein [Nevskiales bacterium]
MRPTPLLFAVLALAAAPLPAAEPEAAADTGALARRVEELKLESVKLARDLWLLERQLGEEENSVTVFLSLDAGAGDAPESVEIRLGDEIVTRHSYTPAEQEALRKGGAHRLYAGTLAPGRHVLEAQLSTRGDGGQRRPAAKLSFRSGEAPKTIELRLERLASGDTELTVREWD